MSRESQDCSRHLPLHAARRVVIKLGTSIVTNEAGGFKVGLAEPIAREIATLQREGRQVVLVSSGAVGLGAGHLGLAIERRNDVATKQARGLSGRTCRCTLTNSFFECNGEAAQAGGCSKSILRLCEASQLI
jgi:glutamate 5-kinase